MTETYRDLTITHRGFRITQTYSTRLINNRLFSTGDIEIMEYEINAVFNENNYSDTGYYYPKRMFSTLLQHMTQIIYDDPGLKSKFCFGLNQKDPYQNPHNIQTMGKDIEVEVDFFAPTFSFDLIKNNINDIVNSMEDNRVWFMNELEEGVRLTVAKIEMLGEGEIINTKSTNGEKTFRQEKCVICLEEIPNVLFCLCGHICICEKCKELGELNFCPVCKKENTILRIIE